MTLFDQDFGNGGDPLTEDEHAKCLQEIEDAADREEEAYHQGDFF